MLLLGAVGAVPGRGSLTFLIWSRTAWATPGTQPPIFWSVYITTFVFWVGIGHAAR